MSETQSWPDPSVVKPPDITSSTGGYISAPGAAIGDQQFPGVGVDPYSATALQPRRPKQTSAPASVDQIPVGPEAEINKATGYDPATGKIQPGGIYDLTRQKQEATEAANQRLIDAEQEQLRQLHEAHRAVAANPNDLKPWDAQKEQAKYSVTPTEAALNPGFWLAIAASAFTRTPMVNALSGAAASINALKDGKDEEFKRAYDAWRQNSELAVKRHEMAHQDYEDAIQLYDKDVDLARQQAIQVAMKYDDKLALSYLQAGLDDKMIGLVDKRDQMFKDWAQTNSALPEHQVRQDVYNGMMKQINDLKQQRSLPNDSPLIIAMRNRAAVALGAKTDQDESKAQVMFQWQLDHANDHDGNGPTAEEVFRQTNAVEFAAEQAKKGKSTGSIADGDWQKLFYAQPKSATPAAGGAVTPTASGPTSGGATEAPAPAAPAPSEAPRVQGEAAPVEAPEEVAQQQQTQQKAQVTSLVDSAIQYGSTAPTPEQGDMLTGLVAKNAARNKAGILPPPPPDPREQKIQLAMAEENTPEARAQLAQLVSVPIDGDKTVDIQQNTGEIPQDTWEKPFGDRKFNESALDGLTPGARAMTRMLVEGKLAPPTGFLLAKNPFWQAVLERAAQYDPSFDTKIWSVRGAVMKDMLSGVTARNTIRRLNTFAQHIGVLNEAETNLNNWKGHSFPLGATGLMNNMRTQYLKQQQDDRIYAFDVAANAVSSEAEGVFRTTGASVQGIKHWRDQMDSAMSLDAARRANYTLNRLVLGQGASVADRWNKAFNTHLDATAFFSPEGRDNIKRINGLEEARLRIEALQKSVQHAKTPQEARRRAEAMPQQIHEIQDILRKNGLDPKGLYPENDPDFEYQ